MALTIEILVLLLGVVAAVAFVADRLRIPEAILLVLAGVMLALVPGLPPSISRPTGPAARVASDHLFLGGRDELARLPLQLEADIVACVRLCPVHRDFGGRRHSLDAGILLAGGLLLGAIVSPPDAVAPLAIARRLELRGGCSSFSRAKASPTTRPPWCCIDSPSPP